MFFKSNFFRGALTSKPYAFLARPWEFKSVDSIDFFDSLGSNIRIDLRGDKILRILPRSNDLINEDWISDKIRFICDAARLQRLDSSILKLKGEFFNISWTQVFDFLVYLNSDKWFKNKAFYYLSLNKLSHTSFFSGLFVDLNSAAVMSRFCLNFFYKNLNSDLLIQNYKLGLDRNFLFFNIKFDELVNFQNLFLVDLNIKTLAPVLAIRLRNLAKAGVKIYNFGRNSLQPLFCDVGSLFDFNQLILGKHWLITKLLKEKSFFLFGDSFKLNSTLFRHFLHQFKLPFGVLASNVSSLNLKENSVYSTLFDLSANTGLNVFNFFQTNCSVSSSSLLKSFDRSSFCKTFKTSLVSHGGDLAELSDFILPISSPFEQSKFYLNTLKVKQKSRLCFSSPNNVLDHSDFLNFFYSALLKNNLLKSGGFYLNFDLLGYFLFFSNFYLVSSKLKIWNLINYFFDTIENNNSLVLSQFVLFVFSDSNFLLNEVSQDDKFLLAVDKNLKGSIMPTKLKNFGLLNDRLLSDDNFYQNDEISLISSTLSSASTRLINKSSFSF